MKMLKTKRIEIILILFFTIISFLFFSGQLINLFKTDFNSAGYYYSHQFDNPMRWINTGNLKEIGATLGKDSDDIVYRFPKKMADRVYIKLLFGKPYDQIDEKYKNINALEICTDTYYRKEFNYSNLYIGENKINLTKLLSNYNGFSIKLKKLPPGKNKFNDLMVRRIEVSVLPEARNFLPNLSLIITAIFIPFILFHCFKVLNLALTLSFIFSFLSLIFYCILCHFFWEFFSLYHLSFIIGVFLLYLFLCQIKKIKDGHLYFFIFIVLLTLAINLRWSEIERVVFAIPHPDTWNSSGLGFRQYADSMKFFTKEGFFAVRPGQAHEPLYPAIAKIFFIFFGSSDLHLKYVSFFFSIVSILLTYIVGKEIFKNNCIPLFAVGLISVNNYLISQASYGLRLELETSLLLTFFYFCYLKREVSKVWLWIVVSGSSGGLLLLTRSYYLPFTVFLFIYSIFKQKRYPLAKKILLFLIVFIIAISFSLPDKINSYREQGVVFPYSKTYATVTANYEFAGQPGFPKEEVTLSEYLFKLHTPLEFVVYNTLGVGSVFYFLDELVWDMICEQNHLVKLFNKQNPLLLLKRYFFLIIKVALLSFIFICALLVCLSNAQLRPLVYVIVISNFHNFFLYGGQIVKGFMLLEPLRTIAQVFPFLAFCVSWFLFTLLNLFRSSKRIQCA